MAERQNSPLPGNVTTPVHTTTAKKNFTPKYSLPLPIRTFPLPAFYPNNPVSLLHLAYAWLGQVFYPPPAEPSVVHQGVWSAETRSVHVTDPKSMSGLWCQGFFGKGSLSRSEPNWLNRARSARSTSEQRTVKRREERANTKWERGRTELEAIEKTRREEQARAVAKARRADSNRPVAPSCNGQSRSHTSHPNGHVLADDSTQTSFRAPVGPLELLALPNSDAELLERLEKQRQTASLKKLSFERVHLNGYGCKELNGDKAPTGLSNGAPQALQDIIINGIGGHANRNGTDENGGMIQDAKAVNGFLPDIAIQPIKRQKSVRFSPHVEATTFQHSDPPSPSHAALVTASKKGTTVHENGNAEPTHDLPNGHATLGEQNIEPSKDEVDIVNKEHLQLSIEEAFFLAYGVGALTVTDPKTKKPMTTQELFALFRQHSYMPPRPPEALLPDDPFLVQYAVYHHFRSLGWVPRHGIKFGVDWLLYGKGPALDHAEFGLMVMPSYTDPEWKALGRQSARKSWHWLHSVNRVLSTVYKTLVLVYVDIPAPQTGDESASELLGKFRIREVMVKRWSTNRNR